MALTGKLEFEVEIQSPATEFFHFFTKNLPNLANATGSIHAGEIHQGDDWHATGSVKKWSYTVDGKVVTCKERFEEIDEENKTMKVEFFEGDVNEEHKSFKFTLKAIDKEGGGGIAKWCIFYDKVHEGIPEPRGHVDFLTLVTKDVDAHLLSAQKGK